MLRCIFRGDGLRVFERLGVFQNIEIDDKSIWIHAVSVGELLAARPIVDRILCQTSFRPVITTTTQSGSALVKTLFKEKVHHAYFPFDLPVFHKRFLRFFKPSYVLVLETELWPNFLQVVNDHNIQLYLLNARLSESSFRNYYKLGYFFPKGLGPISGIFAQNKSYAQLFKKLGYEEAKIFISGNIKYDSLVNVKKADFALNGKLVQLTKGRLVITLGSTRPGEELLLLNGLKRLLQMFPKLLVVVAPRHPKRAREVSSMFASNGFKVQFSSTTGELDFSDNVLIVDSLGILNFYYQVSNLAFVGGSLLPYGGHNVMEPCFQGVPTLTGPYTHNFEEEVMLLKSEGAIRVICDSHDLVASAKLILESRALKDSMTKKARKVIDEKRGAINNIFGKLSEYTDGELY